MTNKRYIRTVAGEIYDMQKDKFINEEYVGKPIEYEDKVIKLLNTLNNENNGLKKQITSLKVELDTHKHPLWSTREAERKVSELTELLSNETKKNAILLEEINSLRKENMRLKEVQKFDWYKCRFMIFKDNRNYCQLNENWCKAYDCKEQMI